MSNVVTDEEFDNNMIFDILSVLGYFRKVGSRLCL